MVEEITIGVDDEVERFSLSDSFSDSDSMRDFDNSDESDSDYIRGDSDAYYGGYGHCFRCGKIFVLIYV